MQVMPGSSVSSSIFHEFFFFSFSRLLLLLLLLFVLFFQVMLLLKGYNFNVERVTYKQVAPCVRCKKDRLLSFLLLSTELGIHTIFLQARV